MAQVHSHLHLRRLDWGYWWLSCRTDGRHCLCGQQESRHQRPTTGVCFDTMIGWGIPAPPN
uniref:Uncharacterized protein n=1 Tax=Setaria italica TaxID=4555 RepID=K3YXJ3_SETIT